MISLGAQFDDRAQALRGADDVLSAIIAAGAESSQWSCSKFRN
jgi:hypothetical protein